MIDIIANIFLLAGSFFIITSAIGIIRMRDFFTRSHPAGINDSLSLPLILIGIILKLEPSLIMVKLFLIIIFSMLTAATASHALSKSAIYEIEPKGKKDKNYKDGLR